MKIFHNNKFKIVNEFLAVLLATIILMGLLIINTFHDDERFVNTSMINTIISEQTDKIYEYCVEPNAFNFRHSNFSELFNNTKFLDPNYQFIVKTDINSFQSISDNLMEKKFYTYVGTNTYTIYDSFNVKDVTVYIESYISTSHFEYGDIYNIYQKFITIDKYFPVIIAVLIILLITSIVYMLVIHTESSKGNLINSIYYELPLIVFLLLINANSNNNFTIFNFTNYFTIFAKLYLTIVTGLTLTKLTLSRLANKSFMHNCLIFKTITYLGKFIKYILTSLNRRFRPIIIVATAIALEVFLITAGYFNADFFYILWLILKLAEGLLLLHYFSSICRINSAAKAMQSGATNVKTDTKYMYGLIREQAECMNNISIGLDKAVQEKIKSEQLKTELITNVSHDLKTPLTSIINYVDLMKKEKIDNQKLIEYLEILDKHSMRLKTLTENVIEASKAATGNMKVDIVNVNIDEMITQALGEYEEKFKTIPLNVIYSAPSSSVIITADGGLLWRVIDNLLSNVCKYSLENTRVYIDITESEENLNIIIKNISKNQLNISSEELMQRFVRGDSSRSTNGNGLGLSIAQSLMNLQNGGLEININGDLFTSRIYLKKGSEA